MYPLCFHFGRAGPRKAETKRKHVSSLFPLGNTRSQRFEVLRLSSRVLWHAAADFAHGASISGLAPMWNRTACESRRNAPVVGPLWTPVDRGFPCW